MRFDREEEDSDEDEGERVSAEASPRDGAGDPEHDECERAGDSDKTGRPSQSPKEVFDLDAKMGEDAARREREKPALSLAVAMDEHDDEDRPKDGPHRRIERTHRVARGDENGPEDEYADEGASFGERQSSARKRRLRRRRRRL